LVPGKKGGQLVAAGAVAGELLVVEAVDMMCDAVRNLEGQRTAGAVGGFVAVVAVVEVGMTGLVEENHAAVEEEDRRYYELESLAVEVGTSIVLVEGMMKEEEHNVAVVPAALAGRNLEELETISESSTEDDRSTYEGIGMTSLRF
jgi:hypothetical protein